MEMEITKHTTTTVQLKQELVSITNKYNLSETTCDKYAQYCSVLLLITNCRVGYETKWKSYKHKQNNHVWSCSTLLVPVFFIIYFFFFLCAEVSAAPPPPPPASDGAPRLPPPPPPPPAFKKLSGKLGELLSYTCLQISVLTYLQKLKNRPKSLNKKAREETKEMP